MLINFTVINTLLHRLKYTKGLFLFCFFFFILISVYNNEPITLMNLKPMTKYRVQVQLTRPGDGGEGPLGPEAIMETECLGEFIMTNMS